MNNVFFVLLCASWVMQAQTIRPDLRNPSLWTASGIQAEPVDDAKFPGIRFNETQQGGLYLLNQPEFSEGSIEFDIKGRNQLQQSFVGLAFHIQNDSVYDAIYFRPFNFRPEDTARRARAVQYISSPKHHWFTLRAAFPGKYENKVNPVPDPDGWFHVRIDITGQEVKVYVNNNAVPSLAVSKLSSTTTGKLGLWVGNQSDAGFANLKISPHKKMNAVPYGNNKDAGSYCQVGDARIYYEVYGQGRPIVLLHGGVYGYIDEFSPLIERLAGHFQVICIGTRGHGKSEMGKLPFTWSQRANDAYQVIRSVTNEKTIVIGFSDGAYTAYKLAASYPQVVDKLIAIGAGDFPKNSRREKFNYSPELLMRDAADFFQSRLALMPEPNRWAESLQWLNQLYNNEYLSKETFQHISCPTLLVAGDRDQYHKPEYLVNAARYIPESQLCIINGCDHVVLFCNFPMLWESIRTFINSGKLP